MFSSHIYTLMKPSYSIAPTCAIRFRVDVNCLLKRPTHLRLSYPPCSPFLTHVALSSFSLGVTEKDELILVKNRLTRHG